VEFLNHLNLLPHSHLRVVRKRRLRSVLFQQEMDHTQDPGRSQPGRILSNGFGPICSIVVPIQSWKELHEI
ncbi:hypothetical protein CHS0354_021303, partial [Potamilus streckersoni]